MWKAYHASAIKKLAATNVSALSTCLVSINTGWPKKVSHYRESLLNRIKKRQPG